MAFCQNCGAKLQDTDVVCSHCGAPVDRPASYQVPKAPEAPKIENQQYTFEQPAKPQTYTPPQPAEPQTYTPPQAAEQQTYTPPQPQQDQGVYNGPATYEPAQPSQPQYQMPRYDQPQNGGQQPQYQPQYQPRYNTQAQNNDSGSFGWGVLGFCIPLVGLILFLVWKNEKPNSAKVAGLGALISVIITVVFNVIAFLIGMLGGM